MAHPGGGRGTAVCVLVGVDTCADELRFPTLRGNKAAGNVHSLAAALRSARSGGPAVRCVPVVNPQTAQQVRAPLEELREHPPELLVFYYFGHGYLDPHRQDRLHLVVKESRAEAISTTAPAFGELVELLKSVESERTVVVLDCCFSGDAVDVPLPMDRSFGLLTSSYRGMLISPGADEDPMTPFTANLVRALRERPRTLIGLGIRMNELARVEENQPPPPYLPWQPVQYAMQEAGDTVLPPGAALTAVPPLPPGGHRREEPHESTAQRLRRAGRRIRDALRRRLPAVLQPWRWGCLTLTGALVAGLAPVGVLLFSGGGSGRCPPPLELRMATAPEEVGGVSELAREFERSPENHRAVNGAENCRIAGFTVYGASLDGLSRAFGESDGWSTGRPLAEVGPQPDLWAAQTSAEVARVRGEVVPPAGVGNGEFLTGARSLMSDLPVLVLTESARKQAGLPSAYSRTGAADWKTVRDRLGRLAEKAGQAGESADKTAPRLLRPNPMVSGAGLAHALGMYARRGTGAFDAGSGRLPDGETVRLETGLISQGRSTAGTDQALCGAVRGDAAGALVTARQAQRYGENPYGYCLPDSGSPGGDTAGTGTERSGAAGEGRRLHRYVLRGGPLLDYPLVTVGWPADDKDARQDAADRFRGWAASGT